MKFEQALQILRDGGKVRRPIMRPGDWIEGGKDRVDFLVLTSLMDFRVPMHLSGQDVFAEDWEVVE